MSIKVANASKPLELTTVPFIVHRISGIAVVHRRCTRSVLSVLAIYVRFRGYSEFHCSAPQYVGTYQTQLMVNLMVLWIKFGDYLANP